MREMFLFIDLLDPTSIAIERTVQQFANHTSEKIHLKFVPVFPMLPLHETTAELMDDSYRLGLDYYAMHIFGARRARGLLLHLQEQIKHQGRYTYENVLPTVKAEGGNKVDFLAERLEVKNRQQLLRDQELVREMKVGRLPTLIDCGVNNCLRFEGRKAIEQSLEESVKLISI